MKRLILPLLIVLLMTGVILSACNSEPEETTVETAETTTQAEILGEAPKLSTTTGIPKSVKPLSSYREDGSDLPSFSTRVKFTQASYSSVTTKVTMSSSKTTPPSTTTMPITGPSSASSATTRTTVSETTRTSVTLPGSSTTTTTVPAGGDTETPVVPLSSFQSLMLSIFG